MKRADAEILVVDDSEFMRQVFRTALLSMGFRHIDEAPDGEVAMGKVATHHYDVVISDWQMPHMNGIEMLRHIRSTPGLEWLPVLIVTGHVTRPRILEASDAGVSGFLTKPLVMETLDHQLDIFVGPREGPIAEVRP